MPDFVRAIAASELAPGQATEVTVDGTPLAIYNVDGIFYATSNVCLHRGGPLGQGLLEGRSVMCPWHAWSWDVATGENTANPELKIPAYEVKVADGQVLVKLG
jgi:nitrite reductase/ring-hydroxylating ferredoxin subunit